MLTRAAGVSAVAGERRRGAGTARGEKGARVCYHTLDYV